MELILAIVVSAVVIGLALFFGAWLSDRGTDYLPVPRWYEDAIEQRRWEQKARYKEHDDDMGA